MISHEKAEHLEHLRGQVGHDCHENRCNTEHEAICTELMCPVGECAICNYVEDEGDE